MASPKITPRKVSLPHEKPNRELLLIYMNMYTKHELAKEILGTSKDGLARTVLASPGGLLFKLFTYFELHLF